ncbi:MAG: TonB-dependent receptor [Bacteroidetes bacterium]|nr:MAG: TonB-dependent receptor [Bacteroidota bacterium]
MRKVFTLLFGILFLTAQAQERGVIFGTVKDALTEEPVDLATIYIKGTNISTESNEKGEYRFEVPANQKITLVFTRIGYKETSTELRPLSNESQRRVDVELPPSDSDIEVVVRESRMDDAGMVREDVEELKLLPTTTGNLESVLPHIALGTSSGTGGELTSQYNVRGGNYDENLVYVNDFEIYRPQLIRAGQQEGLTFPNIDLIQSLSFSSGGFEAKYGDKLSSVLDIRYKMPEKFKSSLGMSLLGGSAHVEGSTTVGADTYRKFRYLVGARYKTTRYLLGSLDVTGEYSPNFWDVQGYFTYDISRDLQLGVIGNFNRSVFQFVPETRSTALGLIDFALQLFTEFDGQEIDDFTTTMGGVSLTYLPDRDTNPFFLKFLASTYQSDENERFDIIGRYSLRQVESNLGSDNFGDVIAELGSGTQHVYARNFLQANVTNLELKGGIDFQSDFPEEGKTKSHFIQWSAKYQIERIDDFINEWERLDSAGYSLRYDTTQLLLWNVIKNDQAPMTTNRLSAYVQDTYTWRRDSVGELKASVGARASYWDLNKEFIFSPRAQLLYKPARAKKDISWKLASGLYFQPPFYRELRQPDGTVNPNVLSQKSAHILAGFTWDFHMKRMSDKKFRFITEVYYKKLWDLVSYEIDNVRIRYSGFNDATGYVAGVDFRLNGEFVPDAESWFNLSFLRARESLNGVTHLQRDIGETEAREVKDVPRPTDQFMNLSIFFQDYLRKNKNIKMHLNVTVGTGLPYGLKDNNRVYRNTYRFSPYHRVDIGFSVLLWNEAWKDRKTRHPLRFTRNAWLSLEVFNMMKVQNQASNTWIKTIFNQQFAIPNYLTSRRVNLRLKLDF